MSASTRRTEASSDRPGASTVTDGPDEAPAPRARARAALGGATIVLLVLQPACVGGGLFRWGERLQQPDTPNEVVEVRPGPNVVVAVRDLARLESASFHMERVIDIRSTQRRALGLVEAQDSLLLVAAADVVAGVDLADLSERDVVVEDGRAVVTLPAPQIFSARLDNERSYVFQRQTDLLARRRESLETEARQQAERTLREAALEAGILERAERNARRTVESLVRSLGVTEVEVRFTDEG